MAKSLKLKLLFFFLLVNIIILLVFNVFIYKTAEKGISDVLDTTIKIIAIDAAPDFKDKKYIDAKILSDALIDEFSVTPLHIKIIYFNKTKNKIEHQSISSERHSKLFDIPLKLTDHLYSIDYFDKEDYRLGSMIILEDNDYKVNLQLATKRIPDSPYLKELSINLLFATLIILTIFMFLANMLIDKTLFPIKETIKSVDSITSNKLSTRINTNNIPNEIESLVNTFNKLLDDIEESFSRISSFSSDASHELKTPLTVIRGEIEIALRRDRTTKEYKTLLYGLIEEIIQMQEIMEQLFFISKKDSVEFENTKQKVYLDEIVITTIEQMKKFAQSKSIELEIVNIIPVTIYANEAFMKIAISNILKNAIIYSDESSKVKIYMKEHGRFCFLTIEDSGHGIPKDALPMIFDRFFRVDKARSRHISGTGLGLAIVKMILDIHRSTIDVTSLINKGTKVTIKIPKLQNSETYTEYE